MVRYNFGIMKTETSLGGYIKRALAVTVLRCGCTSPKEKMEDAIAKKWRHLSGQTYWRDLLDPLDLDLRRYIIHYGEMAQAAYDTFNTEKASKFAGSSRYAKRDLLAKVGLEKGNPFKYGVTKYLYATSEIEVPEAFMVKSLSREAWSKESNWIAYVGVATEEGKGVLGRRDIVVAWRGTVQTLEWVNDFEFVLVSATKVFGSNKRNDDPKVHQGWYSIYTSEDPRSPFNKTSARNQVRLYVHNLYSLLIINAIRVGSQFSDSSCPSIGPTLTLISRVSEGG